MSVSTGRGCAEADAGTEGPQIAEATVRMDRRYERRFKKVEREPYKCALRPGEPTMRLGPPSDRWVVVRRQGTVTSTEKDSNQPVNVATNRFAGPGTTIKTGRNSVVSIGSLDGNSVLIAPETTVRLTRTGFEVLDTPRQTSFKLTRSGREYKVRTGCGGAVAARG